MARHRYTLTTALAAALLGGAMLVAAGPLDPPSGPVMSTMKTLDQVEARIPVNADTRPPGNSPSIYAISKPGSYYLTGDIPGVDGKHGIYINCDRVTLDLNGFALVGTPDSFEGIRNGSSSTLLTVCNGVVKNWGGSGAELYGKVRLTGLTAAGNGIDGIYVGGSSIVSDCISSGNGRYGIWADDGSVVRDCTASGSAEDGFRLNFNCSVTNCTARTNGGNGFYISGLSVAQGCAAWGNTEHGFSLGDNASAASCSATSNSQNGFSGGIGVEISRCTAIYNHMHGISAISNSRIRENTCRQNGNSGNGAGIYLAAVAIRSSVQGNQCEGNDWGIQIAGSHNLVIGNACSVNTTNFDIVANNRVGKIVALPLSGAIGGDTGGNSTGADPVSNLAF